MKKILWIGGGLIAAYFVYKWWWSSPNSPGYNPAAIREANASASPFANS